MANIINGTDTGSGGLITTGDSSDELQLQTAETARVTLTNTAVVVNEGGNDVDFRVEGDTDANLLFVDASADKVGIGTNTPGARIEATASGAAVQILNRTTSDGNILEIEKDGTTVGSIGSSTGQVFIGGTAKGIRFSTLGFTGTDNTGALSDGAIDIGTSSHRIKDLYLSGSVYLGGTGAANALDDYEEGIWTPTTNGDATGSFSAQAGTYTKIGNQVTVHGQFVVAANFTSALIGGLPFVPKVANPSISGVYSIYVVRNDGGDRYIQIVNSATTVTFQSTMTGTAHNLTTSDNVIRFAMTYQTT